MYDHESDTKLHVSKVQFTRRVRTAPGSTLRGGLRPWVQEFTIVEWSSPWSGQPLYVEAGFGHPFRTAKVFALVQGLRSLHRRVRLEPHLRDRGDIMDPNATYQAWLDAEGDLQARREHREAYNAWRDRGGYAARDEQGEPVRRILPDEVEGQDPARGFLAVNPFIEGWEQWHAWARGYDYALAHPDYDNPLSGEWADQMTPAELHAQLSLQLGYELGDAAFDEVDDAFELGYSTYVAGWRVS